VDALKVITDPSTVNQFLISSSKVYKLILSEYSSKKDKLVSIFNSTFVYVVF